MRVLGIETSGDAAGLAVVDQEGVLAELVFRHRLELSRYLLPRVETVLELAGLELPDVDGIAVATGPGSFTGLRIGVTAAKALAFGRALPIAGVTTLDALAAEYPAPPGALLCAALSASKSELFAGFYQWRDERPEARAAPALFQVEELVRRLEEDGQDILLVGQVGPHRERLTRALGARLAAAAGDRLPRAATVALLGRQRLLEGHGEPAHALAPFYLRPSAAEARREAAGCPDS